ncbi:hypothetical protein INR49_020468 [Caranx melampygus]|nr:hypothetical protein INR49_020468 [Caranx melampygus]
MLRRTDPGSLTPPTPVNLSRVENPSDLSNVQNQTTRLDFRNNLPPGRIVPYRFEPSRANAITRVTHSPGQAVGCSRTLVQVAAGELSGPDTRTETAGPGDDEISDVTQP